uniref:Cytochrome c oxidase subunit 3 n=1 Tax=Trichosia lengersdorfi TaxID=1884860 RepID=A0A6G7GC60_9DIPT|nr:cytochrome c oxidase subunit III [Trichosia lengersdorfi]QIH95795.1 cytochrome c oxidase subunit III [Trichosia lengersdorfi]
MSTNSFHPYHLVNYSPWPLTGAISVMILVSGLVKWFHQSIINLLLLGMLITLLTMYQWWRDISRESTYQGMHTIKVVMGLKWGMILFIISEIFFFLSFFWSFFHSSLSPNIELGMIWPPIGISPFNSFQIPLLNTMILLSSGITITWAHHSLMENNYSQSFQGLLITIMLGIYFTILQTYEYSEASFCIADSIYGSTFFLTTGFHGLHVLIGTLFLIICLLRHINYHFSKTHHFGFEAAAWYWHFVDVVWLLLFISIYWWGGK